MWYSQVELDQSVEVFLDELIQLRQGENVLIYLDQGSDDSLANAIQAHVEQRGGRTEILRLNSERPLTDQAQQLGEVIGQGAFDAICELSEQYFYRTSGWRVAREVGARVFSIAGLDASSFIRCVGKANTEAMFQFGMALQSVLRKAKYLRVFSNNGTDIRMQLKPNPWYRLVAKLQRRSKLLRHAMRRVSLQRGPRPFVLSPSGTFGSGTDSAFLGGQLSFLGIPATIEGTAVIDGYQWPPTQIGQLDVPITVEIEKGMVVKIGGCATSAKILADWFEGQSIPVEHFCVGFNPGARLSGKILEAERVFGSITVGMGGGLSHTDGVIKNPSIEADHKIIEEDGSFVSEQLFSFEKELLPSEPHRHPERPPG